MKWSIPAKTFLLGEYAAVAEASAIVLTTMPCFELSLSEQSGLVGIHPESPGGHWWLQQNHFDHGLVWNDPYAGCGGLGASSAQFLGAYLASCYLQNKKPILNEMLNEYYHSSWSGKGLRPSGYDVIAQSQGSCVFVNKQQPIIKSYSWVFKDLSFILLHTGIKLATHQHLKDSSLPNETEHLSAIVDEAKEAFEKKNNLSLINTINKYHHKLAKLGLVTQHSLELINGLKTHPEVLAIKGCGALGADVLLVLVESKEVASFSKKCERHHLTVLATEANLAKNSNPLILR